MFEHVTVTATPGVATGVVVGVAPGVGAGVALGVGAAVGDGVSGHEVGVTVEPHAARPTAAIVVPMMVVSFMSASPIERERWPTVIHRSRRDHDTVPIPSGVACSGRTRPRMSA